MAYPDRGRTRCVCVYAACVFYDESLIDGVPFYDRRRECECECDYDDDGVSDYETQNDVS